MLNTLISSHLRSIEPEDAIQATKARTALPQRSSRGQIVRLPRELLCLIHGGEQILRCIHMANGTLVNITLTGLMHKAVAGGSVKGVIKSCETISEGHEPRKVADFISPSSREGV